MMSYRERVIRMKNVRSVATQLELSLVHERGTSRLHPYILPMTPITTLALVEENVVEDNNVGENVLVRLKFFHRMKTQPLCIWPL